MSSSAMDNKSLLSRGPDFLKDCKLELEKVSHPTRQETVQATIVTLFIVLFVACILALMDVLFNSVMKAVL